MWCICLTSYHLRLIFEACRLFCEHSLRLPCTGILSLIVEELRDNGSMLSQPWLVRLGYIQPGHSLTILACPLARQLCPSQGINVNELVVWNLPPFHIIDTDVFIWIYGLSITIQKEESGIWVDLVLVIQEILYEGIRANKILSSLHGEVVSILIHGFWWSPNYWWLTAARADQTSLFETASWNERIARLDPQSTDQTPGRAIS